MDQASITLPAPVVVVDVGSAPVVRRAVGASVAVGAAALLGLASWFTPAAGGLGTHEQLNLPQCGWITTMDLPCPTCGMTTAFAHAADGHLVASFLAQPLGCLLAIVTAMALLLGVYVALTGSSVAAYLRRLWRPRTTWLLGGLVIGAWAYKIVSYKGML